MKTASTTRLHMPIFVTLATGLRRGEVLALRWSDIALARNAGGTLTVAQSLEQTKDGLRFKAPTTKRRRRPIALSAPVAGTLRPHRAREAAGRQQVGLRRAEPDLHSPPPKAAH